MGHLGFESRQKGKTRFSFPKYADRLWGPLSHLLYIKANDINESVTKWVT